MESTNENSKNEIEKKKDKRWWDNFGKFCSLILVVVYALYVANSMWPFIPAGSFFLNLLTNMMFYGPMVLIIIVNFEFFADKNIIFRVLIILVWVAIIVLSFFPNIVGFLR